MTPSRRSWASTRRWCPHVAADCVSIRCRARWTSSTRRTSSQAIGTRASWKRSRDPRPTVSSWGSTAARSIAIRSGGRYASKTRGTSSASRIPTYTSSWPSSPYALCSAASSRSSGRWTTLSMVRRASSAPIEGELCCPISDAVSAQRMRPSVLQRTTCVMPPSAILASMTRVRWARARGSPVADPLVHEGSGHAVGHAGGAGRGIATSLLLGDVLAHQHHRGGDHGQGGRAQSQEPALCLPDRGVVTTRPQALPERTSTRHGPRPEVPSRVPERRPRAGSGHPACAGAT